MCTVKSPGSQRLSRLPACRGRGARNCISISHVHHDGRIRPGLGAWEREKNKGGGKSVAQKNPTAPPQARRLKLRPRQTVHETRKIKKAPRTPTQCRGNLTPDQTVRAHVQSGGGDFVSVEKRPAESIGDRLAKLGEPQELTVPCDLSVLPRQSGKPGSQSGLQV